MCIPALKINACQEQESAQPQFEEVQYEMYDDVFVTVVLDPKFEQTTLSFESIAEYDNYLVAIEDSGEKVRVNKEKYEKLIHYCDPFEISVLDKDYQVNVGSEVYKVTQEAIFKRNVNSSKWVMTIYYGLTGDVDLKETELIHINIERLEALESYQFLSPLSKKIYLDKLESKSNGRITDIDKLYKDHVNDISENYEPMLYRDQAQGTVLTKYIRWNCWNEQYREDLNGRAKGGTITEYVKVDINGDFNENGWLAVPLGTRLGQFHANGNTDTSVPWVEARVTTNKGTRIAAANDWIVTTSRIGRGNNKAATSLHAAKIRPNNSNSSLTEMINFYVY